MIERLTIFEVGPRDGLQNEARQIATPDKIALVDMLSATGLTEIEVTSFVSPRWVPQLGDAAEVMAGITRAPGVRYSVLTPNLRGYQAARAARSDMVAIFGAASESFSQKNINCSIAESFERFAPILQAAQVDGVPVRGYISCVTDCPFEGAIAPRAVADVAARMWAAGVTQISLGETLGRGRAEAVDAMLAAVLAEVPAEGLAGHFHDTSGHGLENVAVAVARGLRVFDAAVGGLGGCPYAPGAAGNLATEALVDWAEDKGFETGVDSKALWAAGAFARRLKGGGDEF